MSSTVARSRLLPGLGLRRRLESPRRVQIAAGVLVVLALACASAALIAPLDAFAIDLSASLQAPSWTHLMGTDQSGRDVLALVLRGLRVSIMIAVFAATIAIVIGASVGVLAGALGGRVDALLMRVVDFVASQNHFLIALLLVVLFRPLLGSTGAVLLSVGLTHWTSVARIVRGELLSLRERPFVAAAVNAGARRAWLVRRHFLPHLLPTLGTSFVLLFPHAIFHEAALSFLGVGLAPHQASLGNLLADSRQTLLIGAWWMSLFPGLLLFAATLCVGTLGDHFRDLTQPRWRSELEL